MTLTPEREQEIRESVERGEGTIVWYEDAAALLAEVAVLRAAGDKLADALQARVRELEAERDEARRNEAEAMAAWGQATWREQEAERRVDVLRAAQAETELAHAGTAGELAGCEKLLADLRAAGDKLADACEGAGWDMDGPALAGWREARRG